MNMYLQDQKPDQVIDIALWGEMEKVTFLQGSRDKTRINSPKENNFDFIRQNYPYLYKLSNKRYPWQFWNEIIAYRIGKLIGVNVPPAYIAFDSIKQNVGAIIEWFSEEGKPIIASNMAQDKDKLHKSNENNRFNFH